MPTTYAPNPAETIHFPPFPKKHASRHSRKREHSHFGRTAHNPKGRHHSSGGHSSHSGGTHASSSHRSSSHSRSHTTTRHAHKAAGHTLKDPNYLGNGYFWDPNGNQLVYDPERAAQELTAPSHHSRGTATQPKGHVPKEPKTIGEYDAVGKTSIWHHSHRIPVSLTGTPAHRLPF